MTPKMTLSCLAVFFLFVSALYSQGTPKQPGVLQTKNYVIYMEQPWKHEHPTLEEVGFFMEQVKIALDNTFGKPLAAQRRKLQKEWDEAAKKEQEKEDSGSSPTAPPETEKVAHSSTEKTSTKEKKKKEDDPEPSETQTRTDVYLANDKESFVKLMAKQGIEGDWLNDIGGMHVSSKNTVNTYRMRTLYSTRKTLVHEAIHSYQNKYFPGDNAAYPMWFREALANGFEDHTWDGRKISFVGVPPFANDDYNKLLPLVLKEFRDWIRVNNILAEEDTSPFKEVGDNLSEPPENETEDQPAVKSGTTKKKSSKANDTKKTATKKGSAIPRTVIKYDQITEFIKENLDYKKSDPSVREEMVDKVYSLYWGLGKYLFQERRAAIMTILNTMASDPDVLLKKDKKASKNAFKAGYEAAFRDHPLTVEEIALWAAKHPILWETRYEEWQYMPNAFHVRTEVVPEDKFSYSFILWRRAGEMPPFLARPVPSPVAKNVGLVLNYTDDQNLAVLVVGGDGRVWLRTLVNNDWDVSKIVGTFQPKAKNGPIPAEYLFVVKTQGNAVEVLINGRSFYQGLQAPHHRFGMLLEGSGCEAVFMLK